MVLETKRKLQRRSKEWVQVQQMDAENLNFADNYFDFVFCGFALFFFPSLSTALAEFRRVLKPGGYLAVSIWGKKPELAYWVAEAVKQFEVEKRLPPISLNNETALREVLHEEAFHNIAITKESQIFWHTSPEAWWKSLWSHGTRATLEQLSKTDIDTLYQQALKRAEKSYDERGVPDKLEVIYGQAQKQS